MSKPLSPLGQIVATPGALEALERAGQEPAKFLARHAAGDRADLDDFDRKEKKLRLKRRLRLLSAYTLSTGVKIRIITEADRSATTLLLPSQY